MNFLKSIYVAWKFAWSVLKAQECRLFLLYIFLIQKSYGGPLNWNSSITYYYNRQKRCSIDKTAPSEYLSNGQKIISLKITCLIKRFGLVHVHTIPQIKLI